MTNETNETTVIEIKTEIEKIIGKTIKNMDRIMEMIDIETRDPIPEQILACSRCGGQIVAYGEHGEAFVTEHRPIGDIYYHIDVKKCYI